MVKPIYPIPPHPDHGTDEQWAEWARESKKVEQQLEWERRDRAIAREALRCRIGCFVFLVVIGVALGWPTFNWILSRLGL